MLPRFITLLVLTTAGAFGLTGCRESEPEPPYNYDLGEGAAPLLPTAGTFAGAHDASITKGSARAELFRRGDEAPAEEPPLTAMPTVSVELPPATSVGEAFGNVGKAFLGNLMGGGGAPAGPTAESPTETVTVSGDVPAEEVQALAALFDTYRSALAARKFSDVRPLCAASQQSMAQQFYDLKDELNASLNALGDAWERKTPGSKANVEGQLDAARETITLETLASSGPDGATAVLSRAGSAPLPVTFVREDGAWHIVDPFVPDESAWPTRRDALEALIDRLDDLTATDEGALDESQVQDAITSAIRALYEQTGP